MDSKKILSLCICRGCPSFKDCGTIAFCTAGKSKCIKSENGCLCPGCPVQRENDWTNVYYCVRGSEKQQRK